LEILLGWEFSKAIQMFYRKNASMKLQIMEFPDGIEVQDKKSPMGRIWILSGTAQIKLITVFFTA